jgi:hypothetical protein
VQKTLCSGYAASRSETHTTWSALEHRRSDAPCTSRSRAAVGCESEGSAVPERPLRDVQGAGSTGRLQLRPCPLLAVPLVFPVSRYRRYGIRDRAVRGSARRKACGSAPRIRMSSCGCESHATTHAGREAHLLRHTFGSVSVGSNRERASLLESYLRITRAPRSEGSVSNNEDDTVAAGLSVRSMPDGVRTVLEGSSVLAAFIYGFGWVLASRFYGTFGVSPEEVGVGFAFLLVRAVFVLIAGAVVLGSIWGSLRWLSERVGWLEVRDPLRYLLACAGLLIGVLATTIGTGDFLAWVSASVALSAFSHSIGDLVRSRVERAERERNREASASRGSRSHIRINGALVLRVASWTFGVITLVLVMVAPFVLADRLADQVRSGKELAASVLPRVAGLRVQRVLTSTTDGMPVTASIPAGSCLSFLGSANEVAVLYDNMRRMTARVPVSRISLEQPCRNVP